MNKRARNRLIGVTAIVLLAVGGLIYYTTTTGSTQAAYYKKVDEVAGNPEWVGKKVQVGGPVIAGSWDQETNPMRFQISDDGKAGGKVINVVYGGVVPSAFGDGTEAIVTGIIAEGDVLEAETLITKCPSKYESKTGAESVDALLKAKEAQTGKPVKVTGPVKAGSIKPSGTVPRFELEGSGGETLPVAYDAALPQDFKDGAVVVLGGSLGEDGVFKATSVAIGK